MKQNIPPGRTRKSRTTEEPLFRTTTNCEQLRVAQKGRATVTEMHSLTKRQRICILTSVLFKENNPKTSNNNIIPRGRGRGRLYN